MLPRFNHTATVEPDKQLFRRYVELRGRQRRQDRRNLVILALVTGLTIGILVGRALP